MLRQIMGKDCVFEYPGMDCLYHSFTADNLHYAMKRIPEREVIRTKGTLPIGTKVSFSQIICRAGYFVEHHDMPEDLLKERSWEYLQKEVNGNLIYPEKSLAIAKALNPGKQFPDQELSINDLKAVYETTG